ncbi:MAG: hypothetical protein EOP84_13695 [Verrucomicrobiaceae bacterium]|nr:MAG: hypothetical protein EOP84_13695 [Verrucomicrobiaceae bacterium]
MSEENNVATETENRIELGISDIQNAVAVIDYACDQGAFKGWNTIEQVLQVRARLKTFVDAATASQNPEGTTDEAGSETPATETEAV